jgi:hypothetical protein
LRAAATRVPAEQGGGVHAHRVVDRGAQQARLGQLVQRLLDPVEKLTADAPRPRVEIVVVAVRGFDGV